MPFITADRGLTIYLWARRILVQKPELLRADPPVAAEGTAIELEGYRIGADLFFLDQDDKVRVAFLQQDRRFPVRPVSSDSQVNDSKGGLQHLGVIVPAGVTQGLCQVVVEADGQTSSSIMIQIVRWVPAVISRLSPLWAGPGETVFIDGSAFNGSDKVELFDAGGEKHLIEARPQTGPKYTAFRLPKDLPEGQYLVRVLNAAGGEDQGSNNLSLWVSAGPLPFDILDDWLKPAAPGQWLDLIASNNPLVAHADRVEVAFRQGSTFVAASIRYDGILRARIPPALAPGEVEILNRAWAGDVPSFWSGPVPYHVLDKPAPPAVDFIELGLTGAAARHVLLQPGPDRPEYFTIKQGESFVLGGTFPAASDNTLRIEFYNSSTKITARVSEVPGCRKMRVDLPAKIKAGEWRLALRSLDDNVLAWLPVTMRVEPGAPER
jgi:hypothetical protein